jgi:septal ring-binding cell division protein DamX
MSEKPTDLSTTVTISTGRYTFSVKLGEYATRVEAVKAINTLITMLYGDAPDVGALS